MYVYIHIYMDGDLVGWGRYGIFGEGRRRQVWEASCGSRVPSCIYRALCLPGSMSTVLYVYRALCLTYASRLVSSMYVSMCMRMYVWYVSYVSSVPYVWYVWYVWYV